MGWSLRFQNVSGLWLGLFTLFEHNALWSRDALNPGLDTVHLQESNHLQVGGY